MYKMQQIKVPSIPKQYVKNKPSMSASGRLKVQKPIGDFLRNQGKI